MEPEKGETEKYKLILFNAKHAIKIIKLFTSNLLVRVVVEILMIEIFLSIFFENFEKRPGQLGLTFWQPLKK